MDKELVIYKDASMNRGYEGNSRVEIKTDFLAIRDAIKAERELKEKFVSYDSQMSLSSKKVINALQAIDPAFSDDFLTRFELLELHNVKNFNYEAENLVKNYADIRSLTGGLDDAKSQKYAHYQVDAEKAYGCVKTKCFEAVVKAAADEKFNYAEAMQGNCNKIFTYATAVDEKITDALAGENTFDSFIDEVCGDSNSLVGGALQVSDGSEL
jgi:hypothetical protein